MCGDSEANEGSRVEGEAAKRGLIRYLLLRLAERSLLSVRFLASLVFSWGGSLTLVYLFYQNHVRKIKDKVR